MNRATPLLLALGLVVLGGTVAGELVLSTGAPTEQEPATPSAGAGPKPLVPMAADMKAIHATAIEQILGRPLFARSRRPPSAPAPAAKPLVAAAAPLPRLSGIMITRGERRAIFSLAGAARPVTALAGGQVGAFTVETIDTDRVVLRGADGPHDLRPSYVNPPAAADAGLPRPNAFLAAPAPDGIANASQGGQTPEAGPDGAGIQQAADSAVPRFTRGSAARVASNRPELGR